MDNSTPQKKRRFRFTRRSAALVVAFLMIAAPAGASVIIQNYMQADITATPPCFVKTTGTDATTDVADFSADPLTDTRSIDGVDLLEEQISVQGMIGDRVIYTDVVRYENNCTQPIDVLLVADALSGDWANLSAEIWISNVGAPANVDPNVDVAADQWQDDNIMVTAGAPAGPYLDQTGVVTVLPGDEIQGAVVVSSDVAFLAGTASITWVAQATLS